MELDITNFLPKYPNITKLSENIFNTYIDNFSKVIYKKKEFYDNKLKKVEKFPKKIGTLLNHQKLITRFFSSHTLYDQLLLVHEMGSGKTCTAVGAIEQIRQENKGIKGALYLAKGDALINNFINELIFKCTDGRYIPENYDKLSELEKIHRKKKAIKDYYNLQTFETFAKKISKTTDNQIQKQYNNTIIVIDEVHNLRIQSKEKGLNIYNQFLRFLHVVKDCKILLMSGTPMKDNVEEISSVMNLILPYKNGKTYLPSGDDFINEFFDINDSMYSIKENKKQELKKTFKGRVSYLKAMQSSTKKVFKGTHSGNLKHLKVVVDVMGDFQEQIYKKAAKLDKTERQGVYSKSRQASLFVFPDGTYGEEGYNKYIKKTSGNRTIVGDDGKKKKVFIFTLEKELRDALLNNTNGDTEKILQNLEKYSSKYASSIRTALKAYNEGKSMFIYNEFVQGSGLILFGLILELVGFKKASGGEKQKDEGLRYASLTNLTATNKQLRQLINRFNQPDNINGKIINIIMGSRKIAEGFSLLNVQVEDIHTPWFNYSETAQAIARGYRLGSHRMLLEKGERPQLDIYQRVSITKQKEGIDLEMYEISEIKDISIKKIERLIREAAWDCSLTYNRNHITGYDNERECDYMSCEYSCDGISTNMIKKDLENSDLDYSTYQQYYSTPNTQKIIDKTILIFRDNFRLDLLSLIEFFPDFSSFEIISALRTIINENIKVVNKYGFLSYLKEEKNIYFLVDSLGISGKIFSDYYTEFPNINKSITFEQVVKPLYFNSLPKIVSSIKNSTNIQDIRKIMIRVPLEVKEMFIEGSISADINNIEYNKLQRKLILEYFNNYFAKIGGIWMSWFLFEEQEILRCIKNNKWVDCGNKEIEKLNNYRKNIQVSLEKNPYGYYGQYNIETQTFCIRDVSNVKDIEGKGHKMTSGKVCINWDREDLVRLAYYIFKIPLPPDDEIETKILRKWTKIKKNISKNWKETAQKSFCKNILSELNPNTISENEKELVLFWCNLKKKELCYYIEKWLNENNLLVEDKGCGKGDKKKPR